MNNKILVLVPHPDDEINVAGQAIYRHRKENDRVYVVFMTNGDYQCNVNRMKEAIESLAVLGVKRSCIMFLGYGDGWSGGRHIYECNEDEVVCSAVGKRETYGIDGILDYSSRKRGYPNEYTRNNLKSDIKTVIEDIWADIIYCVDFDSHPDHRALSLLFEECMGEILKANMDYRPKIYKKFAYGCSYSGVMDYYENYPLLPTARPINRKKDGYDLDNPYYLWDERVSFEVHPKCKTKYIVNNIIYKAAQKHKSQDISRRIGSICNQDIVFWERRTDNLSLEANVVTSSGEGKYLNDFKLFDCKTVLITEKNNIDSGFWSPSKFDNKKSVLFLWDVRKKIEQIVIYQDVRRVCDLDNISIKCDNDTFEYVVTRIGVKTVIEFKEKINTKSLLIAFEKLESDIQGIGEIEIFEKVSKCANDIFQRTPIARKGCRLFELVDKKVVNPLMIKPVDSSRKYVEEIENISEEALKRYFRKNQIYSVAIYGYGELGRCLAGKIKGMVVACIDRRAYLLQSEFIIYDKLERDVLDKIDCLIISIYDSATIREIKQKVDNDTKCVCIKEVVGELRGADV